MRTRLLTAIVVLAAVAGCTSDDDPAAGSGDGGTGVSLPVPAPTIEERDEWATAFDEAGVVGTFAARRIGDDVTHVYDVGRAETERLPASTFKILNSMVILQTGTVADVDETIEWDGVRRDIDVWNRDHSLRSGIEVSAVWMYQELARRVGEEAMAEWVADADYGNADVSGGIDQFWLTGELRISPLGQLDFLERMVEGSLPFDEAVVDSVREIIVREEGDDWTWSHKTGTALAADPTLGWLVGTTEWNDEEWVFAMNVDLVGVDGAVGQIDPQVRQEVSRVLLADAGALPDP